MNRAERRRVPRIAEAIQTPIVVLDAAQALGLNAAQENLNRARAQLEQAQQLHIKIMTTLGLDPESNYELDASNGVYLKK